MLWIDVIGGGGTGSWNRFRDGVFRDGVFRDGVFRDEAGRPGNSSLSSGLGGAVGLGRIEATVPGELGETAQGFCFSTAWSPLAETG